MTTSNRSETFGRLLKAGIASIANCEGKTAPVVEDDLGTQIGVVGKSIQRYKAGYVPPDPRTIQIIAEACVRRGMMGREWLEAFLHHARYPFAEKLLNQLRPLGPIRPPSPRIYENLPAPTYSQFVMREQAFAEVIDGLQQRSAAVLIVGLGGNGKTSLAREVAARCLRDDGEAPRFDAVVWVSDKDRPATTNFSTVLDEIARTLDYPGFAHFEHDEKRREVEQLLRRHKVLLVVDNFETITDGALLGWLLRLPEPSKVIITTREYWREFRRGGWPVELRGMSEAESWELISERARALKVERLVGDRAHLEPLLVATGGNPKAITITLGLLKYEHRPLQQVVDDLYAARSELFEDLFARAWALLDEAARRVLLVATFFPTSVSGSALSTTADMQGFAFDRAVERLTDMALLDVQHTDLHSLPRYMLHPLVRAFAGAKLGEQPGFEEAARIRWIRWATDLAAQVGFCWNDLERLKRLDPERDAILRAIQEAFHHNAYPEVLRMVEGIEYYLFVRGAWNERLAITWIGLQVARTLGNLPAEAQFLADYVKTKSQQGHLRDLEPHVQRLQDILAGGHVPDDVISYAYLCIAVYFESKNDVATALAARQQSINASLTISVHRLVNAQAGMAGLLLTTQNYDAARALLEQVFADSQRLNYHRIIVAANIGLARLDLIHGDIHAAEQRLVASEQDARLHNDTIAIAEIQMLYAKLAAQRGNVFSTRQALTEAMNIFERMGLRHELAEVRAELAKLDAPGVPNR